MNTSVELTPEQKVFELNNNPNLTINEKIIYHISTKDYRHAILYNKRFKGMAFDCLKLVSLWGVVELLIYFFN